jgi:predicted transcriptional regulator
MLLLNEESVIQEIELATQKVISRMLDRNMNLSLVQKFMNDNSLDQKQAACLRKDMRWAGVGRAFF